MIKEYCDICKKDVTGKQTGSIHAGSDCDRDGNGTLDEHWDMLCQRCYKSVINFLHTLKNKFGE